MCPREKALPVRAVLEQVKMPSKARPRLAGEGLVLAVDTPDGEEAEVHVALGTGDVIAQESAEIADEHGADRPDHDQIATYDARYEITWNLDESEHVFDTYHTIAYRIRRAVGGVTFDLVEKTFVEA
jgi:hypothetical protein